MNDWGPRFGADYKLSERTRARVGAALTTIPPNLSQTNYSTGGIPTVLTPRVTAAPSSQISYGYQISPSQVPPLYTPAGVNIYGTYKVKDVPANTPVDIQRLELDLAAAEHTQSSPLNVGGIARSFGSAGLGTWTASLEHSIANVTLSAAYVGTSAWKLPRVYFPNAYAGATADFARYTTFDSAGTAVGGFGTETIISAASHSNYHALQVSGQGQTGRGGPGFQANYTWSKSIDDTSTVGGTSATSTVGAIAQAAPQNPFDTHSERGPSTFDITNSFSLSLTQDLPLQTVRGLDRLNSKITNGWQLVSISTMGGGIPFTVYSGVQQTGAGASNADRPDQIGVPQLSTARSKREDYFGRGDNNGSFFFIPVNVAGGTGPNQGRFGRLGRNSFRGPAFYDYDISLVKNTSVGHRASGRELVNVQFRSEFFNLFNIVNMGLPSNTIAGSGFGQINRTAGNSRQIQFSLKIAY
jgi:hypothetical protein